MLRRLLSQSFHSPPRLHRHPQPLPLPPLPPQLCPPVLDGLSQTKNQVRLGAIRAKRSGQTVCLELPPGRLRGPAPVQVCQGRERESLDLRLGAICARPSLSRSPDQDAQGLALEPSSCPGVPLPTSTHTLLGPPGLGLPRAA